MFGNNNKLHLFTDNKTYITTTIAKPRIFMQILTVWPRPTMQCNAMIIMGAGVSL